MATFPWARAAVRMLLRCTPVVFALMAIGVATASAAGTGLLFDGNFTNGLKPWWSTGGGAQCANYKTPATAPRARGNMFVDDTVGGIGGHAARFDLPASTAGYPLQACELTNMRTLSLGADEYYGYMFYVPNGFTDGTTGSSSFWGIATAQFHFQNVWGAPISYELHSDHMTLALETGSCNNQYSADPGCQYRSNADNPSGNVNLGSYDVVPPPMQTGVWHEIVMHVHWASDSSGQIQVWHRIEGDTNWTQTVDINGIPTVQWDATTGCCTTSTVDKIGAYRGAASAPVSVWEDNAVIGTSFAAVTGTMPMAPNSTPTPANPVTAVPVKAKVSRTPKKPAASKKKTTARQASASRARARRSTAHRKSHGWSQCVTVHGKVRWRHHRARGHHGARLPACR